MTGRGRVLAGFLVLVAACAACDATPVPPTAPSGSVEPQASTAEPTDCRTRIEKASLANDETISRVSECRFTQSGVEAAAQVLTAGGSDDAIWAAIWVYATGATDPSLLRPVLDRKSGSLRALASAGLVALGDRTGFEVLGALTDDDGYLVGSHPPITIQAFAISTLARYVTVASAPTPGSTGSAPLEVAKGWKAWLAEHAADLVFDPEAGRWTLP